MTSNGWKRRPTRHGKFARKWILVRRRAQQTCFLETNCNITWTCWKAEHNRLTNLRRRWAKLLWTEVINLRDAQSFESRHLWTHRWNVLSLQELQWVPPVFGPKKEKLSLGGSGCCDDGLWSFRICQFPEAYTADLLLQPEMPGFGLSTLVAGKFLSGKTMENIWNRKVSKARMACVQGLFHMSYPCQAGQPIPGYAGQPQGQNQRKILR